jgi:hypothetical protein
MVIRVSDQLREFGECEGSNHGRVSLVHQEIRVTDQHTECGECEGSNHGTVSPVHHGDTCERSAHRI